jgi:signal transduction histidine kinase
MADFPHTPTPISQDALTHDHLDTDSLKGIGHELRTPLNVIIGICQFLERDRKQPLTPLHRDAVNRMERNARSLLHSVNHLIEELRNKDAH